MRNSRCRPAEVCLLRDAATRRMTRGTAAVIELHSTETGRDGSGGAEVGAARWRRAHAFRDGRGFETPLGRDRVQAQETVIDTGLVVGR